MITAASALLIISLPFDQATSHTQMSIPGQHFNIQNALLLLFFCLRVDSCWGPVGVIVLFVS